MRELCTALIFICLLTALRIGEFFERSRHPERYDSKGYRKEEHGNA